MELSRKIKYTHIFRFSPKDFVSCAKLIVFRNTPFFDRDEGVTFGRFGLPKLRDCDGSVNL